MRYLKYLFSPVLMGILFVLFAVAMAVATFLENDFGSSSAYSMVYNTRWFEVILLLLATNLVGQLIIFKLFRRAKLPVFLFHLSFILMIIGAGITRYFGWEGTIHIREGEEQKECFSNEKYIGYSIKDNNGTIMASHSEKYSMTSVSADNFKKTINIDNKSYELVLAKIIPNASEVVSDSPEGEPIFSLLVMKDMMSRKTLILKKGDIKTTDGISIGFASAEPADVNISVDSGKFFIRSGFDLGEMSMMTQAVTLSEPGKPIELKQMQVLTAKDIRIVPQQMSNAGIVKAVAINPKEQTTGLNAFIFHLLSGKESATVYLWDSDTENGATGSCETDGKTVEITYGSKSAILPFSIKLNDFVLERYPGSNSPSGYKSDVILLDKKENVEKPFKIFVNNILKYKGYRFYQSSFDRDEKGTILSVNHDMAGMLVTYTGYTLLFIFIILSLLNRNSVFHIINAGYWQSKIRKAIPAVILILFLSGLTSVNAQKLIPDKSVSEEFGKVLVQDQKGRTKPLFALSNDILRKVTRENKFEGLTAMQVFLGVYLDFDNWKDVPMIKVSNKELQKSIGISGNLAAFSDLVSLEGGGSYKLTEAVSKAYSKAPGARTKADKEIMKVDERVNILYIIYSGGFLKIFPLHDGSHNWGSPDEALKAAA
ncbi:MAG: cytochrome c biogenesis protein ResB, partial [Bacteroidia bacterium]|nr:cytochrome c biogenesis protein ResB [Bacteroidia bacterium]